VTTALRRVAATLAVVLAGSLVAAAPATAAPRCEPFAEIPLGRYWVNNNLWGQDDAEGHQCVDAVPTGDDTISWTTEWEWSGAPHQVKSYASAVLGWHWGWKAEETGLPVRIGDGTPVRASWDFTLSPAEPGTTAVAYDLWAHDVAEPDWGDDPTDEIMVWLHRTGGAGPLGEHIDTVTVEGARWDLYRGRTHWNVYSFVRSSNTTSAELDLSRFLDHLVDRGEMDPDKHLSSVQAGIEVFTGSGTLTTDAYEVAIGGEEVLAAPPDEASTPPVSTPEPPPGDGGDPPSVDPPSEPAPPASGGFMATLRRFFTDLFLRFSNAIA
jgi:hypothetical protein